MQKISIIIPTYNEAENIARLLQYLTYLKEQSTEIIVVDGGSMDATLSIAATFKSVQLLTSPKGGRNFQMNWGAKHAQGEILYFLHADGFPPRSFQTDIRKQVAQGLHFGTFMLGLITPSKMMKLNVFFTRYKFLWAQGGDQSLFINASLFAALGGYAEHMTLMEEYDLIKRARKVARQGKVRKPVLVIDRKLKYNGYWRLMWANFLVFNLYRFGASPNYLKKTYQGLLKTS